MMEGFTHDWLASSDIGHIMHMDMVTDLHDGGFEPQTRARSNTWPCPPTENFIGPSDEPDSTKTSNQQLTSLDPQIVIASMSANSKKNSSRRNAWGNLSYADLITRAISSAVDKRLTLNQIYEWMVTNVPYFKDKGDSNSSAGWKNSIRHNLSLHNRFTRVQNEGTGKSSWWMLNPDAKSGKSVRRRAASMETSRYEKRRGRAKKRVDILCQTGITGLNDNTPSPSSSISEGLDRFSESPLHSYPISPDFRQRATSNASSCGRLSPRPTLDWNFSSDYQSSSISAAQSKTLDQLAGTIAEELKFQKDLMQQGFSGASGMTAQAPPPPYPSSPLIHPHQHPNLRHQELPNQQQQQCLTSYGLNSTSLIPEYSNCSSQACILHRSFICVCKRNNRDMNLNSPNSVATMSPAYPNSEPSSDSLSTYNNTIMDGCTALSSQNASMLVTRRHQQQHHHQPIHQQQQQHHPSEIMDRTVEGSDSASTLIGQCMEALNSETSIAEFNIDNFQGGLECNIEELIRHEMSIDGRLDFNIPLTAVNGNQNIQANAGDNNENFMNTLNESAATTSIIQHQHSNELQLQTATQQQPTQTHNELPLMLNNMGMELSATQPSANNLNVRVQYTQANVVTAPSFVH